MTRFFVAMAMITAIAACVGDCGDYESHEPHDSSGYPPAGEGPACTDDPDAE